VKAWVGALCVRRMKGYTLRGIMLLHGDKRPSRAVAVNKSRSGRSRHRVVGLLWETLIALALVVTVVAVAIFYADHESASWMPSPQMLRPMGWSLVGFGFGAMYLYLALVTRRLEQKISNMPQLRQFITFSRRWFVSLGVSGLFFIFGIWSLWPVLRRYKLTPPAARIWTLPPASLQVVTGLLWMLGGIGILELTSRMNPAGKESGRQRAYLASYALPVGMVVYGALRVGSGFWLLLKD